MLSYFQNLPLYNPGNRALIQGASSQIAVDYISFSGSDNPVLVAVNCLLYSPCLGKTVQLSSLTARNVCVTSTPLSCQTH